MEKRVMEALKKPFRPEFLNRIDETIIFHSLGKGISNVSWIPDQLLKRGSKPARSPLTYRKGQGLSCGSGGLTCIWRKAS
jgi:ATP-dependent Clp protease ATP-binding subunit ClpA